MDLSAYKPTVSNPDYAVKIPNLIDELSAETDKSDAATPAFQFGERRNAHVGLNYAYYGGTISVDGVTTAIADGSVLLAASNTNYVERTQAGVVSANTAAFSPDKEPMAVVTTGPATITAVVDSRSPNRVFTGLASINVAGGAGTTTLTAAQAAPLVLEFTGAQTGDRVVEVPNIKRVWLVRSKTSGAYRLVVRVAGQTGRAIAQGTVALVYCDGTDIVVASVTSEAGALATGRNIAARTNAATPNTKFDMSADELVLRDANGNSMVVKNVAVTVNMGAVGANGIDAGAQAASTWYYGYVVAKPDGTVAGLASTSATAPTLPAGYTFKALVTAARSDGSTHFIKYRQTGNEVDFEAGQSALASGTAGTETAVSLTSLVPSLATRVRIFANLKVLIGSAAGTGYANIRTVSGSDAFQMTQGVTTTSNSQQQLCVTLLNLSQNLYYLVTASGTGVSSQLDISVLGFKLPIGGE